MNPEEALKVLRGLNFNFPGCRGAGLLHEEDVDALKVAKQALECQVSFPRIKGWVARDKDGAIILYAFRPRRERTGFWKGNKIKRLPDNMFPWVIWESVPEEVELIISLK